jgi:very-short-patch-repair endonuclease
MTDAERRLWSAVRMKKLKNLQFYRQKIIGNFIVDFFCPGAKLVIEVDGGQHYSSDMVERDKTRDEYLNILGIKVLRFNNNDVINNIEGVIERILAEIPL